MTETVWVAFISAGAVIITALATQLLAARSASQIASRAVDKEARDWQRSESRRRQELHDERLREFWAHVLLAQTRIINGMIELSHKRHPMPTFDTSGTNSAAEAYAIALLGLVTVRPQARDFYNATADVQNMMLEIFESPTLDGAKRLEPVTNAWRAKFNALEAVIQQDYLVHTNAPNEARAKREPSA